MKLRLQSNSLRAAALAVALAAAAPEWASPGEKPAIPASCPPGYSAVAHAAKSAAPNPLPPATWDDLVKQYVFLNLAFPQHDNTMVAGLTSYFFTHDIPFRDLQQRVSPSTLDSIYTAMNRTHAAHGIKIVVDLTDAERVANGFLRKAPFQIEHFIRYIIQPETVPRNIPSAEVVRIFLADPKFTEQLAKTRAYAQTIQAALRSPELREISRRGRAAISEAFGSEIGDTKPASRSLGYEAAAAIVARLIREHPELGAMVPSAAGDLRPLAWDIFIYMSTIPRRQ